MIFRPWKILFFHRPWLVASGIGFSTPSFMQSIHPLLKRSIFDQSQVFGWELSEESHDWYGYAYGISTPDPPFDMKFVQAGPLLGLRWSTSLYVPDGSCCEVNWLDPEPRSDQAYVEELQHIISNEAYISIEDIISLPLNKSIAAFVRNIELQLLFCREKWIWLREKWCQYMVYIYSILGLHLHHKVLHIGISILTLVNDPNVI